MTIAKWLKETESILSKAGVPTARLDSLIFLEDVTGKDRAWLLAHPEFELSSDYLKKLDVLLERRARHEPLAYIRGKSEFYGRDFYVDARVLEPRPESETIIDLLKQQAVDDQTVIVDVGTGSGMLAITAELELPQATVAAMDIDANCLEVAKRNAETYKADISFYQGNLLDAVDKNFWAPPKKFFLLCNLPYVPDNFQINTAATHEPKIAIFGGPDGLDLYRKLFAQIDQLEHKPTLLVAESLPPQHEQLAAIAGQHRYQQTAEDDFIQLFSLAAGR